VYFGNMFGSPSKMYACRPDWIAPAGYKDTILADWGRQCPFTDGCGAFTLVDCATSCVKPTGTEYKWGPTCTVAGVSYHAVNAYVPKFRKARDMVLAVPARLSTTCTGCLDGAAVESLGASAGATMSAIGAAGATVRVLMDVRYANASATAQNLRVMVGTTSFGYVMNGTSQNWSLPTTGGAGIWKVRTIGPFDLPASAAVKLVGPAAGSFGARIDVASFRMP